MEDLKPEFQGKIIVEQVEFSMVWDLQICRSHKETDTHDNQRDNPQMVQGKQQINKTRWKYQALAKAHSKQSKYMGNRV